MWNVRPFGLRFQLRFSQVRADIIENVGGGSNNSGSPMSRPARPAGIGRGAGRARRASPPHDSPLACLTCPSRIREALLAHSRFRVKMRRAMKKRMRRWWMNSGESLLTYLGPWYLARACFIETLTKPLPASSERSESRGANMTGDWGCHFFFFCSWRYDSFSLFFFIFFSPVAHHCRKILGWPIATSDPHINAGHCVTPAPTYRIDSNIFRDRR